jgi:hypothetical protein
VDDRVRIVESYRDYTPPFDVSKVVRTLLSTVPEKYLTGLDCVVLTHTDSVPRRETRRKVWSRKHKVRLSQVRGLYHGKWQGKPPWIELRVEKILGSFFLRKLLWVPFFRRICLGEVHITNLVTIFTVTFVQNTEKRRTSRTSGGPSFWQASCGRNIGLPFGR